MKKCIFLLATVGLYLVGQAQTDTTEKKNFPRHQADTIRIGGMIIIRKGRNNGGDTTNVEVHQHKRTPPANVSTSWGIVDLGFNNYNDNTNYASNDAQQFAPGSSKDWFKLRNGKSVNVNVWIFMQRLNLVKHVINLKYGLGLELNNYRYEDDIRYKTNPTVVYKDQIHYSKNKLATDYLTVPLMLNFNFTPGKAPGRSFGFSVGATAGYLYASRQKFISDQTGKKKEKDDFDLRPFKIAYVGELQLGPVKLYGSLATRSMFEKGLDQTPYALGVRLTNW